MINFGRIILKTYAGMLDAIAVYLEVIFVPTDVTLATITTAINTAIKLYSIAVAAASFCMKFLITLSI